MDPNISGFNPQVDSYNQVSSEQTDVKTQEIKSQLDQLKKNYEGLKQETNEIGQAMENLQNEINISTHDLEKARANVLQAREDLNGLRDKLQNLVNRTFKSSDTKQEIAKLKQEIDNKIMVLRDLQKELKDNEGFYKIDKSRYIELMTEYATKTINLSDTRLAIEHLKKELNQLVSNPMIQAKSTDLRQVPDDVQNPKEALPQPRFLKRMTELAKNPDIPVEHSITFVSIQGQQSETQNLQNLSKDDVSELAYNMAKIEQQDQNPRFDGPLATKMRASENQPAASILVNVDPNSSKVPSKLNDFSCNVAHLKNTKRGSPPDEDFFSATDIKDKKGTNIGSFACVCDGHSEINKGGELAAKVSETFTNSLQSKLSSLSTLDDKSVYEAIKQTFIDVQRSLRLEESKYITTGTTFAGCLTLGDRVWTFNLGDTRIVCLGNLDNVIKASEDHIPDISGGKNTIGVGKSFGDFAYDLPSDPCICVFARSEIKEIAIFSDGIPASSQKVGELMKGTKPDRFASNIATASRSIDARETKDDITFMQLTLRSTASTVKSPVSAEDIEKQKETNKSVETIERMKKIPQGELNLDKLFSIAPELSHTEVQTIKNLANAYVKNSDLKGKGIDEKLLFAATCLALKKYLELAVYNIDFVDLFSPLSENMMIPMNDEQVEIQKVVRNEYRKEFNDLERLFLKSCDYNLEVIEKEFYTEQSSEGTQPISETAAPAVSEEIPQSEALLFKNFMSDVDFKTLDQKALNEALKGTHEKGIRYIDVTDNNGFLTDIDPKEKLKEPGDYLIKLLTPEGPLVLHYMDMEKHIQMSVLKTNLINLALGEFDRRTGKMKPLPNDWISDMTLNQIITQMVLKLKNELP